MKYKIISIATLGIMLSGCSFFSPEYKKPNINAPINWESQDIETLTGESSLPDLAWWEKFNDPQLNILINDGLKNNNNIQMAMGNILQAQASIEKSNYSWLPTVGIGGTAFTGQTFNPSFTNKSSIPTPGSLPDTGSQKFSGYSAGFVPTYSLNIMRQIKMGEVADFNLAAQIQAKNAIRLAVISQISGSYFTFLGLKKQLNLQRKMLFDAKQAKKYIQVQYDNGSVSSSNLIGIDQMIATLNIQIPSIENKLTNVQNALQVLTDKNPGKIITHNNFDNIKTNGIIPINLPSEVLKSRPDIAMAENQLQLSNANIGAAASKFFPSISLTGMLGGLSAQLTNLFSLGTNFWAASLGAAMPILDMGIFADIKKSKGSYYSAFYNYIQTVRTAFAQVDNGLSQHSTINQSYTQQKIALESAEEQYRLSTVMYELGQISYLQTLLSKMNVDYMKSDLNKYKMQQMDSIVNLYDVFGRGYNVDNELEFKKFNDEHDV